MPFTLVETLTFQHDSATLVSSRTFNVTTTTGSGSDRKIILQTDSEGSQAAITGITFDGVAMTLVRAKDHTGGSNRGEQWYIDDASLPATAGTYEVIISYASTTAKWINVQLHSTTGLASGGPEAQGDAESASSPVGGSITTVAANAVIIGWSFHNATNAIAVADSQTTILAQQTSSSSSLSYYQQVVTPASTNVGCSSGGGTRFSNLYSSWALAVTGPSITDVDTDEIVSQGQTGVTITGATFEATQGTGTVKIAKTDNIADANVVTQTVTSWADTSIQFTANFPTDVAEGEGCFLFVTNNTGDSNSSGFAITREDITAPTLTSPTAGSITSTGVTPSCSTNEATGTMYMVVVPDADVPSVAQIKAGQQSSGAAAIAADNDAISATGVHTFAAVTGLSASTPYEIYFVHADASANDSTASTVGFTTSAAVGYTTTEGIVNNTGTLLTSTAVSWTWLPLGRVGSINGITALDGTGTTDATTATLTVTGMSAGAGILLVADLVTDATDDLVYYEAGTAA